MSTLTDSALKATYSDGMVCVEMKSGARYRFPVAGNPRLAKGSSSELSNIEISPFGLHWPDLDEALSLNGIARGDYGQTANGI